MEIVLDKRAVRQIRLSAQDAIEEGDIETLREDILEAFTEEQVEEIERRLDSGDFFEFLTDMLDEWSGDDADELFELIDTQLGDVGVDVKFEKQGRPPTKKRTPRTSSDDEDVRRTTSLDEDEDEETRTRKKKARRARTTVRLGLSSRSSSLAPGVTGRVGRLAPRSESARDVRVALPGGAAASGRLSDAHCAMAHGHVAAVGELGTRASPRRSQARSFWSPSSRKRARLHPERVVAQLRVREVRVEGGGSRARLRAIVQPVAVERAHAEHRRHVARALVAADDARRLALREHLARGSRHGVVVAPELLVEDARAPERVVEERAVGVGPARRRSPRNASRARRVVAEGLEVLRLSYATRSASSVRSSVGLERARSSSAACGPLLVLVRREPAQRDARDAVAREAARDVERGRPSRVRVAAARCVQDRRVAYAAVG